MQINYNLTIPEWIILAGLLVTIVGLIRFYIVAYVKIYHYKSPEPEGPKPPVSVVLSGKDQYEALRKNLTFWLEQKYPDFEVVVVYEDTDEDNTKSADDDIAGLLKDYARRYKNLVLINANQSINFFDEQKFSLSIGAKSAHNDIIIMTHPQVRPSGEYCIDRIQAAFKKDTQIVLGHAVFSEQKRKICSFNLFKILEQSMQYLGFAIGKKAFTGRQCIIAYRKEFFLEHQGFSDSYALDCGGFDRFNNRIKKSSQVNVQICPEAQVKYTGRLNTREMRLQERFYHITRRASQGSARKEMKAFDIFRNLYFWFICAGIAWFCWRTVPVLYDGVPLWALCFCALFLIKFTTQAVIVQKAAKTLGYGTFWFLLPFYNLFSLVLQLFPKGRKRMR